MRSRTNASPMFLAHHWYMARRGGERVFEHMAALYPEAPIGLLCVNRRALSTELLQRSLRVSPLRLLTPRWVDHRMLLPLYPWATRRVVAPAETKLVLSSDASVIKGLQRPAGSLHICYCHSPPRYLWELSDDYLKHSSSLGGIRGHVFKALLPRLQAFDRAAAKRVDVFIANSDFVAERIKRVYGREAQVLHPAVDVQRFSPNTQAGDFYLIVSELVAYKRVDLAIEACSKLGRKLVVVGDGPEMPRLRGIAGDTVRFAGRIRDDEVNTLMATCRALLHPQVEDFGIAPVEAQAAGRPVIAFRAGGALETVVENVTGVFFNHQDADAMAVAIQDFEGRAGQFTITATRQQAERFTPERFRKGLLEIVSAAQRMRSLG